MSVSIGDVVIGPRIPGIIGAVVGFDENGEPVIGAEGSIPTGDYSSAVVHIRNPGNDGDGSVGGILNFGSLAPTDRMLLGNDPFLPPGDPLFFGTALNIQPTAAGAWGTAASINGVYMAFNNRLPVTVTAEVRGIHLNTELAPPTGTIANAFGIALNLSKPAGATISGFFAGLYIGTVSGASTNNYGIFVDSVTGTGAFAIHTGAGVVHLGDVIETVSANESTGSGTALLGTNSPAVTNSAPYKWLKFKTSDGSTVFVPAWK